jgi:hypothetical protein
MARRKLNATVLILTLIILASFSAADSLKSNAKKLLDDNMNDASTGTITSYQPNREKEPAVCNNMMAKALVAANAEKAEVIKQRDSLAKTASLLSDRVSELEKQLQATNTQIEKLNGALDKNDANEEADQLAKTVQNEADEKIAAILANVAAEKEENIKLMDDLKMQYKQCAKEMVSRFEEESRNAAEQIGQAHIDANLRVEHAQNEADKKITTILANAAAEKEESTKLLEDLKMQFKQYAKEMTSRLADEKRSAIEEIRQAHIDANLRVKHAQAELHQEKLVKAREIDQQNSADEKVAAIIANNASEKEEMAELIED